MSADTSWCCWPVCWYFRLWLKMAVTLVSNLWNSIYCVCYTHQSCIYGGPEMSTCCNLTKLVELLIWRQTMDRKIRKEIYHNEILTFLQYSNMYGLYLLPYSTLTVLVLNIFSNWTVLILIWFNLFVSLWKPNSYIMILIQWWHWNITTFFYI